MSTTWNHRIGAVTAVLGLTLALGAAALAPGAMARPRIDTGDGSAGAAAQSAPVTTAPEPGACDPAGGLFGRGVVGPLVTAEPMPVPCPVSASTPPPTMPAPTPTPAPATPTPTTGVPVPGDGTPAAPSANLPGSEAPKPAITSSTPAVNALANAIVIRSRSVSVAVTVPAGLPATSTAEISILFGYTGSTRQTQTYNPAAGNRFVFGFAPGDGQARTEDVAVSLLDRAGDGAHVGFVSKVRVEPLYDVEISPLSFWLIDDCDWFDDSEIGVTWWDDRGENGALADMSTGETRTFPGFARSLTGVGMKDALELPSVSFDEFDDIDFDFLGDFVSRVDTGTPNPPLLLETSRNVVTEARAAHEDCTGQFSFTQTITLLTYPAL